MKDEFYEPYKYYDPFIERDDRPSTVEEDEAPTDQTD